MNIKLKRISQTDAETFGVIIGEGGNPLCLTLERPWLNNQPNVSCIPTGTYQCIRHDSEKFKHVWEITNVPNRTSILIHNGNTVNDIIGCACVGRQYGPHCVSLSVMALDDLRAILPDSFTLTIEGI